LLNKLEKEHWGGLETDTKPKSVYTPQFGSKNKLSDLFSATARGADFKEGAAVCFFLSIS